jgi:branched-chain amino acid transport system substrate-binding protein
MSKRAIQRTMTFMAAATMVVTATGWGSVAHAATAANSTLLVGSFDSLTSPIYTNPDDKAGLVAGIDAINAAGGLDGHPLKLVFCDSHQVASAEVDCTQQLISDKVIAAISPLVTADSSGREWQLFKAAGIPVIGTVGTAAAELNNTDVFPLSSGLPGWDYGAVANLVASGARHIVILDDGTPPAQFNGVLAAQALKLAGLTPEATVVADPSSDPSLATAAAKATASGVDGILLLPSPPNIPKLMTAIQQSGYKGKISTLSGELVSQIVKATGSALNGVLVSSQEDFPTDTTNPAIVKYRAAMAKYQPSAGVDDDSLRTWTAAQLFVKVAGAAKATTASAVLAAFNNLSKPVRLGTIAPYAVKGRVSPIAAYSRLFNPTTDNGVFENGKVIPNGKGFIDPFKALEKVAKG